MFLLCNAGQGIFYLVTKMPKDCYYFTHDYSARHDPKLECLFLDHGIAGIGAYWCIVEMMYEQGCRLEKNYERLAKLLRVEAKFIASIIEQYDLFIVSEDSISSASVQRRFQERMERSKEKSDARSVAGRIGGIRSGEARRSKSKQSEANEPKERKEKERKEKEKEI